MQQKLIVSSYVRISSQILQSNVSLQMWFYLHKRNIQRSVD